MMNEQDATKIQLSRECTDYLRIDSFIETLPALRLLKSGFELGLIDDLLKSPTPYKDLELRGYCSPRSLQFLVAILVDSGVLMSSSQAVECSPDFRDGMKYRDLLEAKLDFTLSLITDFSELCTDLLIDIESFISKASLLEIFDYGKCFESTESNHAATARWMRYTTALTRYESKACIETYDLKQHQRILDIGGNSGEFVRQICATHPTLTATVMDLPVVCDVGQSHLSNYPEGGRIQFQRGDAFKHVFADGHDLITFKSMLHDWPDEKASELIEKAYAHLPPGGSVLIYERKPIDFNAVGLPCSFLPIAMFFQFYRDSEFYVEILERCGAVKIEVTEFELDTMFFVATAMKPNILSKPRPTRRTII